MLQLTLAATTVLALSACQGSFVARLLGGEGGQPAVPDPANQAAELAAEAVVEVIEDSAGSFDGMLGEGTLADVVPPGTEFTFTVSETDVQDSITTALASSGYSNRVTIQNVVLADGQISLFFNLTMPPFESGLDGSAVFDVTIDAAGQPVATVVSAEFGQIDAPPGSLDVLNEAISETLVSAGEGVVVTSLTIANGQMTITGYTQ